MDPYRYQAMSDKAQEMLRLPGPYDSTYKSSYTEVPTYHLSPLYDDDRKYRAHQEELARSPRRGYHDNEDRSPRSQREYEPYVPRSYREPQSYRDPSPSRDRGEYRRDPSPYRNDGEYRQRGGDYRDKDDSYRERNGVDRRIPREINPRDYSDQLVDNRDIPDEDKRLIFCQNCFASKQVMTKLSCAHHYCNNCMSKLNASDMFTRAGETNLHHQCNICRTWTSCRRMCRLDPFGRRLVSFNDVTYNR